MQRSLRSARPYGALFQALAARAPDRGPLQQAAQLALTVEFTTIPPYLTALYSIADKGSEAYQALRSVVMEEMFHVNQAANLVVALGALPRFTDDAAPTYPAYLPHANEDTTPLIGLSAASPAVFSDIFCGIETPAPAHAPPQPDRYDTIAQLYEALLIAIDAYPGNPFDAPARQGRQRADIYLGKYGGVVRPIADKLGAHAAIFQIVRQGEGTVPEGRPLVADEPFGTWHQYGPRSDGTYGPILGTPTELSHFAKFRRVSLDTANFPTSAPMAANPAIEDMQRNQVASNAALAFNQAYSLMLAGFEQTFRTGPDPYFGRVLSLMHGVLPNLAQALMAMPLRADGDGGVGPNAGPPWQWVEGATLTQAAALVEAAIGASGPRASYLPNLRAAAEAIADLSRSDAAARH